jgi:hypothetical protein
MSTASYLVNRSKYERPQAMLWADNPGRAALLSEADPDSKIYVPNGREMTEKEGFLNQEIGEYIILSDHNRSALDFKTERIEKRERMINGRMRSYHIADKLSISTSWDMLPSRSFGGDPQFNNSTAAPTVMLPDYTVDGGAGGNQLLEWYETYKGPFWVYLAYDKNTNFEGSNQYGRLSQYNQVIQMYISSFSYSVEKRGGSNHDLWNIQVTLEEV